MIRYQKKATIIDRFDPVLKLVLLVIFCLSFFLVNNILKTAGLLLMLAITFLVSRISTAQLGSARFFLTFSIILVLVNALFTKNGKIVFGYSSFIITEEGIIQGLQKAFLFLGIIFSSLLFVATTDTSKLSHSLMRTGLPYRYGFMLVMAISLAPVFWVEYSTVRNAQVARGLKADVGNVSKISKFARFTFVPLIISALSKVDSLTISMEGRGFGLYKRRTYLKNSDITKGDIALFLFSICLISTLIIM
ncbi:MAG: energy-coupling factor transporter transmembrane component T family protein [Candidatus Methanofastidiosia archaeon]